MCRLSRTVQPPPYRSDPVIRPVGCPVPGPIANALASSTSFPNGRVADFLRGGCPRPPLHYLERSGDESGRLVDRNRDWRECRRVIGSHRRSASHDHATALADTPFHTSPVAMTWRATSRIWFTDPFAVMISAGKRAGRGFDIPPRALSQRHRTKLVHPGKSGAIIAVEGGAHRLLRELYEGAAVGRIRAREHLSR